MHNSLTYKYIDGMDLPLDLYYPENAVKEDPLPLVLCIHGGGWKAMTSESSWDGGWMKKNAQWFAKKGLIGGAISYRSYGNYTLTDLYKDCMEALVFIIQSAEALGIRQNSIVLFGDSAGGHLASLIGTRGTKRTAQTTGHIADNVKESIAAVVACNPVVDLVRDKQWSKFAGEEGFALSPLYQTHENTPPFLLLHGTKDSVVSPLHTIEFNKALENQGQVCEIELLEGLEHAFILYDYRYPKEQVDELMEKTYQFIVKNIE